MFAPGLMRGLAAAIALALLLPTALARSPAADPTSAELLLALADDGSALLEVEQTWTGNAARSLRQSLDVYFGAADGLLTQDELQRIADATEQDMQAETLPWISSSEGPWRVVSAEVEFEGAAGRVSSTEDVRMRHVLHLASGAAALPERVDVTPPWPATLAVSTPAGSTVIGGAPKQIPAGAPTTLAIGPAPEPEPTAQERAAASGPAKLVAGIAIGVLVLGAGALVALFLWDRRRNAAGKRA